MKYQRKLICLFVCFCIAVIVSVLAAEPVKDVKNEEDVQKVNLPWLSDGENKFSIVDYEWFDAERSRKVPVRFYIPEADGKMPLIVFSHGLGGDRYGYKFLAEYWSGHGFACLMLQHPGSDSGLWKGVDPAESKRNIFKAASIQNSLLRVQDVRFAMVKLAELCAEGGIYANKIDMEHAGIAGHSFGAQTTLAAVNSGKEFIAAIPMSAPAVGGKLVQKLSYGNIAVPCLHMTGTLDNSPVGETKAEQRRVPYDCISSSDQYLVNFIGGDHMIFSGVWMPLRDNNKDADFHRCIKSAATAFWYGYLKGDQDALRWLKDSIGDYLNNIAEYEYKLKGE